MEFYPSVPEVDGLYKGSVRNVDISASEALDCPQL